MFIQSVMKTLNNSKNNLNVILPSPFESSSLNPFLIMLILVIPSIKNLVILYSLKSIEPLPSESSLLKIDMASL